MENLRKICGHRKLIIWSVRIACAPSQIEYPKFDLLLLYEYGGNDGGTKKPSDFLLCRVHTQTAIKFISPRNVILLSRHLWTSSDLLNSDTLSAAVFVYNVEGIKECPCRARLQGGVFRKVAIFHKQKLAKQLCHIREPEMTGQPFLERSWCFLQAAYGNHKLCIVISFSTFHFS